MDRKDNESIKVFAVHIDHKIDQSLFNELILKIDPIKQAQIKRSFKWQDAYRMLFADLLLIKVLRETYGLQYDKLTFSKSNFGKPCLKNVDYVHFNLSHSDQWAVCAIDRHPVGIDIEKIDDIDVSIAKNFFSIDEYNQIIDNYQPIVRFFDYWTLKESFIKFTGKGLSQPLNSFCIYFIKEGEIAIKINSNFEEGIYLKQYNLQEDYKMAVCAANNNFTKECIVYAMRDVIY